MAPVLVPALPTAAPALLVRGGVLELLVVPAARDGREAVFARDGALAVVFAVDVFLVVAVVLARLFAGVMVLAMCRCCHYIGV